MTNYAWGIAGAALLGAIGFGYLMREWRGTPQPTMVRSKYDEEQFNNTNQKNTQKVPHHDNGASTKRAA